MSGVVGRAAMLDEVEQAEKEAVARSYAAMLDLLAECRLRVSDFDPLSRRLDAVLRPGSPEITIERGLVWERLPSGSFAWLLP